MYLGGVNTYRNKDVIFEEVVDGFRIHQKYDPPEGGSYGYAITTVITAVAGLKADYEFMKTMLFSKYEKGPFEIYDLDSSDDITSFLDSLQLQGEDLAAHLVQYGVLHYLDIPGDVGIGNYPALLDWGISKEASDGLLLACSKRDPKEVEEAMSRLTAEFRKLPKETSDD